MNVNLIRLKGIVTELKGIRIALERLAECWEMELADRSIYVRPPKADTSGPDPTMEYVDDEMEWMKEQGLVKEDDVQ